MNKSTYILIAVVIILVVGVWWWLNQPASAPAGAPAAGAPSVTNDSTAAINQGLNNVSIQDPDFGPVDADLNSL